MYEHLASNHLHLILACFPNLLDENWAGEIWELNASSSHPWGVCRFVGDLRSGSWFAVPDRDCCIKDGAIIAFKVDIVVVGKCDSVNKWVKIWNIRFCTDRLIVGRIIGIGEWDIGLARCLHHIYRNRLGTKKSNEHKYNIRVSQWVLKYGSQNSTSTSGSKSTMVLIKSKSDEYFRTTEFLNFGWTFTLNASEYPRSLSSASGEAFKSTSPSLHTTCKIG